jgi:hypothetical protein
MVRLVNGSNVLPTVFRSSYRITEEDDFMIHDEKAFDYLDHYLTLGAYGRDESIEVSEYKVAVNPGDEFRVETRHDGLYDDVVCTSSFATTWQGRGGTYGVNRNGRHCNLRFMDDPRSNKLIVVCVPLKSPVLTRGIGVGKRVGYTTTVGPKPRDFGKPIRIYVFHMSNMVRMLNVYLEEMGITPEQAIAILTAETRARRRSPPSAIDASSLPDTDSP